MKKSNYKLSFDDIPVNIVLYEPTDDDNFIFVEFNKQAELTEKLSKDILIGKKLTDIFPGVKSMGLLDVFLRVSKTGKEELFSLGHYEDNRISGWRKNKVSRLDNGLIFVTYEDIEDKDIEVQTYGKQLDTRTKEIEALKEQMELALLGNNDGLWDWNLLDNSVYFSPRWKEILGYSENELPNNFSTWEDRVHPDDKELAKSLIHENIERETDYYEGTHRLRHKDGSWVWILTRGKTIFDEDGKAIRMIGTHTDITAEKKVQSLLQKSNSLLKKLSDNIPAAIYQYRLYPDGTSSFPYASIGIEDIYEVTPENVMNDAQAVFDVVHPDDIDKVADSINKSAETMKIWNLEYRVNLPKNGLRWLKGHAKPEKLEDGSVLWHGFIEDITQEYKTQELLQQKKQELETIFNEAPTPMAIHNEDGEIIMLNKVWEELTGYKHSEINTITKWTNCVAPNSPTPRKEHIAELYSITERIDEGEFEITTKSGKKITWAFSSAPLGIIDGKRVLISTAMDITELKKKDELMIAQSRHAAMGEMIGMIAHQWRQPISAIAMDANNMLLDIALEDLNTTEAEKYANSITEQTQHLSKTIDDFRNFFKPDKVISEINIRETLDTTLSIVTDSLKNNNIELTSSFETDKKVKAYPREYMQVLVNIINNSKDILILNKRDNALISIRVYEDEKYINTEICDNGGGIDVEVLPKIFDPYFSTKDEKMGTGLGLYMSKMIIEEHLNGIIEAYNSGEGACFNIRLLKEQIEKV